MQIGDKTYLERGKENDNTTRKERVRDNIYILQDKLNEFFYATDYFGLSEEVETEEIKKILRLAHKLYDVINNSDLD